MARLFNLELAIRVRRYWAYEVSQGCEIPESGLSRAVHGRVQLDPEERERISKFLAFPESWLFDTRAPVPVPTREEAPPPAAVGCAGEGSS